MTNSLWVLLAAMLLMSIQTSDAVPITGNSHGTVTLVEYYDYECPHCRRMELVIERLQTHCSQLRVVYRATPLLTLDSQSIASFTLAAQTQGQWLPLHQALMSWSHAPTLSDVEQVAMQLKLNPSALLNVMQQSNIQQQLQQNIQLAADYAIQPKFLSQLYQF